MKKYSKQDYLNVFLIIASFFIIFIFLLLYKNPSYASRIDYSYQHYMIPEYFRTLFYETKQLFPSYAFNLGMGQNIYNFSYYGYLSPIILFSYLLPFVRMKTYIEVVSIILYISSIILCYKWISNKVEDKRIRFISTFLFSMAGPLIFHTHRHIMFMCYMPFLFSGLFGVEQYIKNKRIGLLIISNILIITSSYFFSIPALIVLFIYAIYLYLEGNKNIDIKGFIKTHLITSWYFILPVLMSCTLLLPSLKAILDNRFKETTSESILTYLIPNISFKYFLYNSYSMGITAILIVSIIYLLLKKEKNTRFLSIVFLCIICLPIFNYVLNGFMYLNGKVFIPFLPLGILLIMQTLKDIVIDKEKITKSLFIITIVISIIGIIKYNLAILYIIEIFLILISLLINQKYKKVVPLFIVLISVSTFNCIRANLDDSFNDLIIENNQYNTDIKLLFNNMNTNYRTVDLTNNAFNANNIRNINEYKTTMYSSITNKYYKEFYWNIFDTDNPNRNDAIFGDISNPLFNIYFANKYLITDKEAPIGYTFINNSNDYNLYENKDVFSIGYTNNKLMSEEEFNKLKYPYSIEALMNYTIVKENVTSDYKTKIKEIDLNKYNLKDNYKFNLDNKKEIEINIKENYYNKIVIISFDMNYSESCSIGDTYITINNVKNVLTCSSWKYHNNNYSFTYVLSEPKDLNIEIEKGKYDISNLKAYEIDYNDIKEIRKNHDELIIEKVYGDIIKGNINARENSYFNLSIPYDNGYNIYVDGKKTDYEITNKSFIGFKLDSGKHNIEIKYTSPWLKEGEIMSIIGLCLLLVTIGYKRSKNK